MEELFEIYKKLDIEERIKFDIAHVKFNEELKQISQTKEPVEEVINEEVQPDYDSYMSYLRRQYEFSCQSSSSAGITSSERLAFISVIDDMFNGLNAGSGINEAKLNMIASTITVFNNKNNLMDILSPQ